MLIISREQVQSLIERLDHAKEIEICTGEIRRMIDIKSTLLWRADAGS